MVYTELVVMIACGWWLCRDDEVGDEGARWRLGWYSVWWLVVVEEYHAWCLMKMVVGGVVNSGGDCWCWFCRVVVVVVVVDVVHVVV